MGLDWNEISSAANGGTEQMMRGLESRIDPQLLDKFQIIPSRVRGDLDPTRVRILWLHDTADDPESAHLADGGWRRFHRLVFVSHHQRQRYVDRFGIPWSRTIVLRNAIVPIGTGGRPTDHVNLIYTPTPHRGLNLLLPAFAELAETMDDIRLDVFSSFSLYGWSERDERYRELFEFCDRHPRITYHGAVSNDEVREALARSHVFAYPSTWTETSCRCLIEAMSADLVCVHSDLGALYETAGGWTMMYPYDEDPSLHAGRFMGVLERAIEVARSRDWSKPSGQKVYTDMFYDWDFRAREWTVMLEALAGEDTSLETGGEQFTYSVP